MSQGQGGGQTDKLWTTSNKITIARILLVPIFVAVLLCPWPEWFGIANWFDASDKRIVAAAVFVFISCTDWLDGYLARSRNEVTTFGKFMDPLADKILVAAALIALVELGALPTWVVLIILAREFIVSGVRMMAAAEGVVIAASYLGKFKTVFQMIAIVLFTVKDSHMIGNFGEALSDKMWIISWVVMIIALVLTMLSMIDYLYKARDLIGFAPKKADKAVLGPDPAFMDEDVQTIAKDGSLVPDAVASGATQGGTSEDGAGPEGSRNGAAPNTSHASIVESEAQQNASKGTHTQHASGTDSTAADGASETISSGSSAVRDLPGGDAVSAKARKTAQGIVEEATAKGLVVGTAESLTGGLIASSLTAVPGSSAVVAGGIVSYMLSVKDHVLGVDGEVLAREGAVCETVARQMAEGARRTLSCDIAVSMTGIAGPGGAEPGKPVGTVWMGLSSPQGTDAVCLHFGGDRDSVRRQTVETALEALRKAVEQA